ncbi:MAG: hypothetical protein WC822_07180 [Candidatus Paceibacterota bacterium]
MSFKVRVQSGRLKRDYGMGKEGNGGSYRTREGAEKRAKNLQKTYFPSRKGFIVKIVRVLN